MLKDLILVQWSCEVPPEKLEDFLKFAKEKLKPLYESHNCERYELFMPMEVKKYFSYQFTQKKNKYTEQMIFKEIENFEKFFDAVEKDTHTREIVENYIKKFNASSCSFTILDQKV